MYRARTHVNQKACICMYEDTMHMQYHDIIVFDTETSGVKPSKDYIVQLSARKFKNEGGELILKDKRNIYIRPPFFLDKKNIDIHGITNEFLQDKQTYQADPSVSQQSQLLAAVAELQNWMH